MQPRYLIIGITLVVVCVAALWWWRSREVVPPAPPPPTEIEAPAPRASNEVGRTPLPEPLPAPELPPVELPPLNESDGHVREELMAMSPKLAPWVDREDLVRRFAVVIDNAADGDYPRRQLGFLSPVGKFPVIEKDDEQFVMDSAGFDRFDPFVAAFTSVPPDQAASLIRTLTPLLSEAMGELGEGEADPLSTIRAGIHNALATPELEGPVELVQPKVMYQFADPTLEALPPLQKQLIRMGPEHVRVIKEYLREVDANL